MAKYARRDGTMALAPVWLKQYEPEVPAHLTYPKITLPEILAQMARDYPQRSAILFKGHRLNYATLEKLVTRMAAALQGLGVAPGDRVALHLPNCPEFVISYYAALRIGAIVVPCNPLYQAHEMTHQLRDAGAEVLITLSSLYPLIRRIRPDTPLRQVIVAEIKTYFPPLTKAVFSLLLEEKRGHRLRLNGDAATIRFVDFMRRAPLPALPVTVLPQDTAVLMYTGGTTGISKGAELTHANILANVYQVRAWLHGAEASDVIQVQVPLFHCYGMTLGMNLAIVNAMTMILIPDPRDLKDVIQSIHKYRPSLYPGVPAIYNAINNYPHLARFNLNSIKISISGAAGLPVEVQEQFQNLTGARLAEGFGLSEASPVTHANPVYGQNRIGTIGLPWPDTEVKIVDVDSGEQELGPGEVGELCVRGPQVMKGYWQNPTETASALRFDRDGGAPWLYTGDVAVMDEDGYFRIVDRKKDMILGAGGYNIYPREVEDVLYRHPRVLEAAVVGVPVLGKGERIKAFVVLKPGLPASEAELMDFCRENLAIYKLPKIIEFREELPKSSVGKILRRELLRQETDQATAADLAVV
jgi:long-chain acyl-CoA synthetase